MKLLEKIALVTGAGRGIGRGCALELAKDGADLVINDLPGRPDLAETAADPERVYANSSAGLLVSFDRGQSWEVRKARGPIYSYFGNLVASQNDPDLLIASDFEGGLIRSTDGGFTWRAPSVHPGAVYTAEIASTRHNVRYLPELERATWRVPDAGLNGQPWSIPEAIRIETDSAGVLENAELVLVAVPTQHVRDTVSAMAASVFAFRADLTVSSEIRSRPRSAVIPSRSHSAAHSSFGSRPSAQMKSKIRLTACGVESRATARRSAPRGLNGCAGGNRNATPARRAIHVTCR